MTEEEAHFAHLAEGNARQARKRVAADVIIRDSTDRVLLVNPSYKSDWDLPGGMAESNEAPRDAASRELLEELGLRLEIGRLLAVEWVAPHGPWDDLLAFVFDGGMLPDREISNLRIIDKELTAVEFVTWSEADLRLRPYMMERLRRVRSALDTGNTDYHERLKLDELS